MIEHARIELEIVCVGGSKHCPQFAALRSYQIFGFMRWALEVLTQGSQFWRCAPHNRQLRFSERDLVGFGKAERPV